MKKLLILMLVIFSVPYLSLGEDRGGDAGSDHSDSRSSVSSRPAGDSGSARQPVVINLSHGSSGGHNRNFPSQQPAQPASQPASRQPSYGQLNWNQPAAGRPAIQTRPANVQEGIVGQAYQRPVVQNYAQPGMRVAVAVHHHPYTQGYVRKKLQRLGVSSEPSLITDRSEIIHTDRTHSIIRFPQKGPDHMALSVTAFSNRDFNNDAIRNQMMIADSPEWRANVDGFNASENRAGHYYWHTDSGFNYCHYLDNSGYNWYGWYMGNQYFWTRNFNDRWWWYDADYDRWCFWNNGFWWWQDPYHVGDLYCYNDSNYIPCNSAEDQVVVTASNNANVQTSISPDGTRMVKVDADTQDAFLYDTANPQTFAPVYLASGVQNVQFSDTSNGRPLEIILKLNDGSFDMFDGQGNAYNPGAFDADQAAESAQNNGAPPVASSDPGTTN